VVPAVLVSVTEPLALRQKLAGDGLVGGARVWGRAQTVALVLALASVTAEEALMKRARLLAPSLRGLAEPAGQGGE
jgi:hypothetical protein